MNTEISKLVNLVEKHYKTKVISASVPSIGLLEKHCLFIRFENQDDLKKKYKALELGLYEFLENDIKRSEYFDMVALV